MEPQGKGVSWEERQSEGVVRGGRGLPQMNAERRLAPALTLIAPLHSEAPRAGPLNSFGYTRSGRYFWPRLPYAPRLVAPRGCNQDIPTLASLVRDPGSLRHGVQTGEQSAQRSSAFHPRDPRL